MNLLVILADDIGPGDVAAYGGKYPTPLLAHAATSGARFQNAWATPVCLATRAGLMTGLYGPRTGHVGHTDDYAVARERDAEFAARGTVAHALKALGYTTAVAGKWQHSVPYSDCGFDHALVWERWHDSQPTGAGALSPRYWGTMLSRDGVQEQHAEAEYTPDLLADWTLDFLRGGDRRFVLHNEVLAHLDDGAFRPTPDDAIPSLKGSIAYWTKIVDRMLQALPDTLVIIMSDNGAESGSKGDRTGAGARCILIVTGPGVVPGERHQLVDISDIYPTLVELAGGIQVVGRDGMSFAQALWEPSASGRDWIYSWINDASMVRTLTHEREGDGSIVSVAAPFFAKVINGIR